MLSSESENLGREITGMLRDGDTLSDMADVGKCCAAELYVWGNIAELYKKFDYSGGFQCL